MGKSLWAFWGREEGDKIQIHPGQGGGRAVPQRILPPPLNPGIFAITWEALLGSIPPPLHNLRLCADHP